MTYFLACAGTFLFFYILNTFYITVLYHRGLTHGAVDLRPRLRRFVVRTGNWVTGIDPKGWACMHRLHHLHSDTRLDPHSPSNEGVLGVFFKQHRSLERVLAGLLTNHPRYTSVVSDLDFPVHWLNRKRMWWLPLAIYSLVAVSLGLITGAWLLAVAFLFGMMTHPVQGWMVNSFGHRFGYRNFDLADDSRNNTMVAWLVVGEGYQNNHHADPSAAKFSKRWFEVDMGYGLCVLAQRLGLLTIPPARREESLRPTGRTGTHRL